MGTTPDHLSIAAIETVEVDQLVLEVPELGRKLRLLIKYRCYPDMEAIGQAVGRSPVTLRGWANGGGGGVPGVIPSKSAQAMIAAFEQALPHYGALAIERLLQGPADDLENVLKTVNLSSIHDFLATEAVWDSSALFADDLGLGLVRRVERVGPRPSWVVSLGQAFRIEVHTTSRAAFVLGLQSAPSGWGTVPCTFERGVGHLHLPGPDAGGELGQMAENGDPGEHVFVAAQSLRPFPSPLLEAAENQVILDRSLLAQFQAHYLNQDRSTRRLFAIRVQVEARS